MSLSASTNPCLRSSTAVSSATRAVSTPMAVRRAEPPEDDSATFRRVRFDRPKTAGREDLLGDVLERSPLEVAE